jgi:hypothetical protein
MLARAAETSVHLTLQTRALATLLGIGFCLAILELIRRHKLQERYTALWLLVGIGLIVCGVFPPVLALAATVLGVRDTNVALFALLIGGLVLVVLHLTVVVSRQSEQITRLAQELAISRSEQPPHAPAGERDPEAHDREAHDRELSALTRD